MFDAAPRAPMQSVLPWLKVGFDPAPEEDEFELKQDAPMSRQLSGVGLPI